MGQVALLSGSLPVVTLGSGLLLSLHFKFEFFVFSLSGDGKKKESIPVHNCFVVKITYSTHISFGKN